MNKCDAITKMKEGYKLTHLFFSSDEWMTVVDGRVEFEDGCVCSLMEFWSYRTDPEWETGWSLFKETK